MDLLSHFAFLLPIPVGIALNLVLSFVYFRYLFPQTDRFRWYLSLPLISDMLKAIVIWIFILAISASGLQSGPGLLMIGFLLGVLNVLFLLQLHGVLWQTDSRRLLGITFLALLQCTLSAFVMGMIMNSLQSTWEVYL